MIFRHFAQAIFFMFILLISNHAVFQKAEIALSEEAYTKATNKTVRPLRWWKRNDLFELR